MKRGVLVILPWLALGVLPGGSPYAQPVLGLSARQLSARFYVDVLYFRAGNGEKTLTEVYVEIPYATLDFAKTPDRVTDGVPLPAFQASTQVAVVFEDPGGSDIARKAIADTVTASRPEETLSSELARQYYFSFQVDPGPYRLRVQVTDQLTGGVISATRTLTVPSFQEPRLQLSTVQLARWIRIADGETIFEKNGRIVFPNTEHTYATDLPRLFAYFEAYGLDSASAPDSFEVRYTLQHGRRVIRSIRRLYPKPGTSAALSVQLPISDLDLGDYLLTVTVADPARRQQATASTQFFVTRSWNQLSDHDFEQLLEQLSYIATSQELVALRTTPREFRGAAIAEFWRRRDPTPDTPENEALREFYRRIRYANQKFHSETGEGWQTDQGRVYIVLGPPDQVRQEKFESGRPTSEVWEYRALKQVFVFIDEEGFGQYRLTQPFDATQFSLWLPN